MSQSQADETSVDRAQTASADKKNEESLFWEARRGDHHAYIVGTVHILHEQQEAPQIIEQLYQHCPSTVFEADLWNFDADFDDLKPDEPWFDQLTQETRELVQSFCDTTGASCEQLTAIIPGFFCALLESQKWQKYGFSPDLGIDQRYMEKAIEDDRTIAALEKFTRQVNMINEIEPENLDTFIGRCVNANTEGTDAFKQSLQLLHQLTESYEHSDARGMVEILANEFERLRNESPQLVPYFTRILERHHSWIKPFKATAKHPGPILVLVGAGHILGENSFIDLLDEVGYSLKPISAIDRDTRTVED